ncbi:hypothetical protein CR513_19344, partial [Mucuna pruriens]
MAQKAWSLSLSRTATASNKAISEWFTCFRRSSSSLPSMSIWKATQATISKKLQLIHTDLCRPQRTPSLKEVAGVFWKFKKMVENQSGCNIQVLRSDNGEEYTSGEFSSFCDYAGIEHQLSRRNRYTMEMTRCMLHEKNLPKQL